MTQKPYTLIIHGCICRLSALSGGRNTIDIQALGSGREIEGIYSYFGRLPPRGHLFLDVPYDQEGLPCEALEINSPLHGVVVELTVGAIGSGPEQVIVLHHTKLTELSKHSMQPTREPRFYRATPLLT